MAGERQDLVVGFALCAASAVTSLAFLLKPRGSIKYKNDQENPEQEDHSPETQQQSHPGLDEALLSGEVAPAAAAQAAAHPDPQRGSSRRVHFADVSPTKRELEELAHQELHSPVRSPTRSPVRSPSKGGDHAARKALEAQLSLVQAAAQQREQVLRTKVQELSARLDAALHAKKAADQELRGLREAAGAAQRRMQLTGAAVQRMGQELEECHRERERLRGVAEREGTLRRQREQELAAALQQVKRLEAKLRFANESCRELDARLRHVSLH